MPQVPSIKGSLFSSHAAHILKLVSAGETSWDELSRRLEPGDLEILQGPIHSTQWYDIRLYERVLRLRRDIEGDGSNEYLRQVGAESAERLLSTGVYQQLDYLKRTQVAEQSDSHGRFLAFGRDLRLLTSLTSSLLSFSHVEIKIDPKCDDRYLIEYSDASAYPEVLCWANEGFLNRLATEHGEADLWRWERPAPDRVVYRMIRSLSVPA